MMSVQGASARRRGRSASLALACLMLASCATVISGTEFGVQDSVAAEQIERANRLAALRSAGRYTDLAERLRDDERHFAANPFALTRVRHELADLYSHQLLDIEAAVALDQSLLAAPVPDSDAVGGFLPRHAVASQRILADPAYVRERMNTRAADLREVAIKRLADNRQLLEGRPPAGAGAYDTPFLRAHLQRVRADRAIAPAGSPTQRTVLSRLVRAEYELLRKDPSYKLSEFGMFKDGQLAPSAVDLAEIDFLSLASYFMQAYRETRDIVFAEHALDTVYRPYANLRDPAARWRYNGLINDYITALTEANYQRRRFDEMLYYASLNKSRMVLEERLAYLSAGRSGRSLADLVRSDDMPRTAAGLPTKAWFQAQLQRTPAYLDLHIAGRLIVGQASTFASPSSVPSAAATAPSTRDRSSLPLSRRDFGVEDANGASEVFSDEALYLTVVQAGQIQSARKVEGADLSALRARLDATYAGLISARTGAPIEPDPLFSTLASSAGGAGAVLVISPDKWLAKLPFDWLLGRRTTRSVNFFVTGETADKPVLNVAGFFNPTLDLPGAEQEAAEVLKSIPAALIFSREAATLAALQHAQSANIVHLSMHGGFDEVEPRNSKLYFAGAQGEVAGSRALMPGDPNALYARDMARHPALSGRDLVFAAACQTGLSGADPRNDAELLGILRPLTANGNRNVILSLWKVDDSATRDFVGAFYRRLAQGTGITAAFHGAQGEVRKKYRHPYYWAAFYLSRSR